MLSVLLYRVKYMDSLSNLHCFYDLLGLICCSIYIFLLTNLVVAFIIPKKKKNVQNAFIIPKKKKMYKIQHHLLLVSYLSLCGIFFIFLL